jgi:endogenous inhibitor of DNA gyrase (YacG/DUF329 family)
MVFNCPICGKKVEPVRDKALGLTGQRRPVSNGVEKIAQSNSLTAKTTNFFPFCSQRCKLVDLNAWLESQYIISTPVEEDKGDNPDEPENMLK